MASLRQWATAPPCTDPRPQWLPCPPLHATTASIHLHATALCHCSNTPHLPLPPGHCGRSPPPCPMIFRTICHRIFLIFFFKKLILICHWISVANNDYRFMPPIFWDYPSPFCHQNSMTLCHFVTFQTMTSYVAFPLGPHTVERKGSENPPRCVKPPKK